MDASLAEIELEYKEKMERWESLRTWFEEQGYFLYEQVHEGDEEYSYAKPSIKYPDTPEVSFADVVEDPFPYAFMGTSKVPYSLQRPQYSTWERLPPQVVYAQDSQGRHVAIKKLDNDEEYKILRLLKDQPCLQDPDAFPSVLPILDLLQHDGDRFAVMPRWSMNIIHIDFFPTFHLAIQYLISLLEGLVFLHSLRIFHRDINTENTLVNHFSSGWPTSLTGTSFHRHLKSIGALRYAIMDFDLAMILDEKTYGSNPRLPIELVADVGVWGGPYEVLHGYVDFDPFKYDVACLGILFCYEFQQIIVDVPLLAPLFDRMTTADIDKRFTASEALAFARTILPTVSPLLRFERISETEPFISTDRWAGLPESFIAEWGSYRENYSSWSMRLQNWLFFRTTWGWHLMHYFRYTVRVLTYIPHLIGRRFSFISTKFVSQ